MAEELTIVYSSAHKIPENFRENVFKELQKNKYPIHEIHVRPDQSSIVNYYGDLLNACNYINTPYIAIAEDDTLYPDEHFEYRPPKDTFGYNYTRWNLYTWSNPPFFSLRQRKILATMICERQLFVDFLEERFARDLLGEKLEWWGEPGRNKHEQGLGVTPRKSEIFNTYNPLVVFTHPNAFGYMNGDKKASKIRALSLPYWGTAEGVMNDFYKSDK